MHLPAPSGPRRRARRALLAAALPAVLAATALPAAAQAATAQVVNASPNGVVAYAAADGEVNNVRVSVAGGKLVISDQAPITARSGCVLNLQGDAECPIGVDSVSMVLRDRNDVVRYEAPHQASISGEAGDDRFFGGVRQAAAGRPIQPVFYFGNAGRDTIDYVFADRGVFVDSADIPGSARTDDGRPGIDRESVGFDIEALEGSNFGDTLFGSNGPDVIRGRNGNDAIGGGGGNDVIDEGTPGPNGADSINGGGGEDRVIYLGRTAGVAVSLDGVRNDGAPGELDDVRPNVEHITGTNFADTLVGNSLPNMIHGFGGADTIDGRDGNDTLTGGSGRDTIFGGAHNDLIEAVDGEGDVVACGPGTDTARLDSLDGFTGCESRSVIGTLRLAPKTITAKAGEPAQVRLSWRHPVSWRKLRTVELRLTDDGTPVGKVTIRPRGGKVAADGAVELTRKPTRLTRTGKSITARLALRLDDGVAGRTLTAEVEASDTRGARQLERDAGTVRVAE